MEVLLEKGAPLFFGENLRINYACIVNFSTFEQIQKNPGNGRGCKK